MHFYNTMVMVGHDGSLQYYRKRNPTWSESAVWRRSDEPGPGIFDTPFGRIGGVICFDSFARETFEGFRRSGVEAVVIVALWGANRSRSFFWRPDLFLAGNALMRWSKVASEDVPLSYARELGVPTVFANQSGTIRMASPIPFPDWPVQNSHYDFIGGSHVLDARGEVVARAGSGEGGYFVSPVLIRRANRSEASRRIAVPFDMHRLFTEEGYEFIDDIIWEKPEGAGWATGRGRRFAADRNPLQYKPVPVTEYVLVYRKQTSRLIDWNIRAHPNQALVEASKIGDDYEHTNIWRIKPAYDERHPAIFPLELAEKVISYYSFKDDVVLDPFAGAGTVGKAAIKLGRRFVLIEQNPQYVAVIREELPKWLGKEVEQVLTINCLPIDAQHMLF